MKINIELDTDISFDLKTYHKIKESLEGKECLQITRDDFDCICNYYEKVCDLFNYKGSRDDIHRGNQSIKSMITRLNKQRV